MVEQGDVAAWAGRVLFERGDAVGEAGALRCRGRGSQRGAGCHDEDEAAEDRGRMHGHGRDASWFGCFLLPYRLSAAEGVPARCRRRLHRMLIWSIGQASYMESFGQYVEIVLVGE